MPGGTGRPGYVKLEKLTLETVDGFTVTFCLHVTGEAALSIIPNEEAICAAGIDPVSAEPLVNRQHWFTL